MMNFQIFCKSNIVAVAVVMAIALTTVSSSAHSFHHHDVKEDKLHASRAETPTMSVDELIEAYAFSGDDHLLADAWLLLWPGLENADSKTWFRAAWLAQSEHKFELAMKYVDNALALRPRQATALLLKANTAAVMGDMSTARHTCKQTFGLINPVITQACLARVTTTKEQKESALKRLRAWPDVELEGKLQVWLLETKAELAASLGHYEMAEDYYRNAVQGMPSVTLRAGLADVLLAQNRPKEVLKIIGSSDTSPALTLRRLLASKKLGMKLQNELSAIDAQFQKWYAEHDFRHAREMVMFYVFLKPNLPLAMELAEHNVASQKEYIDIELAQLVQRLSTNGPSSF